MNNNNNKHYVSSPRLGGGGGLGYINTTHSPRGLIGSPVATPISSPGGVVNNSSPFSRRHHHQVVAQNASVSRPLSPSFNHMEPIDQLKAAATSALAGCREALQWMENASNIEQPGSVLYTLWEAAWICIADVGIEENVRFLIVLMLKKAVVCRWNYWPQDIREKLRNGTCTSLFALANALGPLRQHWSVVLRQLSGVIVNMAICGGGEEEGTKVLADQALEAGHTMDITHLFAALQILKELAEETIAGNRISKKGALAVTEVADAVINLAGVTWEQMLGSSGQIPLEVQGAFIVAACDCLSKWSQINGLRWDQVYALAKLTHDTLVLSSPLLHYHHQSALHLNHPPVSSPLSSTTSFLIGGGAMALHNTAATATGSQPPRLLQSITHLMEVLLQHPPESCGDAVKDQEHKKETLDLLADALEGYSGPGTPEASRCILKAATALMKAQPKWIARGEPRQLRLLNWLLEGTGYDELSLSSLCLETWLCLHKIPWPERAPALQTSMYQQLLPKLVRRACRPNDLDELLGEEDWEHFREHSLAPVLVKCYEVLRAEYLRTILVYLQPFVQRVAHMTAQELEASFFSLRVVANELSQRASLLSLGDKAKFQAAAKAQNAILGQEGTTTEQIKADAEASQTALIDLARTIVHLKSEVPAFTAASLAVRESVQLVGRLAKWVGWHSKQDPALLQRLALFLVRSLSVPSARCFAAETFRNLVIAHPKPLVVDSTVFETLANEVNVYLDQGFANGGRLLPEEASAVMTGLCRVALSYETSELANAALSFIGEPVLVRLQRQIDAYARSSHALPEATALAVSTDLMTVAAVMTVCASHPVLGPIIFEENWRLIQTLASSTSLPRLNESIADAVFEVLGGCLCLPAYLQRQGAKVEALAILDGICTIAHTLGQHCPTGFLLFVGQLAESWGTMIEEYHQRRMMIMKGEEDEDDTLRVATQLLVGLADVGMELVSFSTLTSPLPPPISSSSSSSTPPSSTSTPTHDHHLLRASSPLPSSSVAASAAVSVSTTAGTNAALDISCELLRAFTIMANYCPSILVSLSYFPQAVHMSVCWVDLHPHQLFTSHAIHFLIAILGLLDDKDSIPLQHSAPGIIGLEEEEEEEGGGRDSPRLPNQTLAGISKALEPHMEVLSLAVVKAVLGLACETHLDDLAGLLRLLMMKAGQDSLHIIQLALHSGISNNQIEVVKLRGPLLHFLKQGLVDQQQGGSAAAQACNPHPALDDYKDMVQHLWGYTQGRNGLDALNGPASLIPQSSSYRHHHHNHH